MVTYTDKALMQGPTLRATVLNSADVNNVTSAHIFKAETVFGGVSIDSDAHNDPADQSAGRLSIKKGFGEIESDGQVLTISRTGGSTWNSLTMRGTDHTSSVIELTDGVDKHLGQLNSHGTRLGFCGVVDHTGSVLAGGLGAARNETFFLQVGNGATVTNVLDVSIADGEVFFYQGLRSTDGSLTYAQVNPSDLTFKSEDPALSLLSPVGKLAINALSDASNSVEYANISGYVNSNADSLEEGRLALSVMRAGSLVKGLEIYPSGASETLVKVSDAYTLPTLAGTDGYVLTTDGAGSTSWEALPNPTTPTLDAVTTAGSTTLNSITVGVVTSTGLDPFATSTYSIGTSSARWEDLHISGAVKFGQNTGSTSAPIGTIEFNSVNEVSTTGTYASIVGSSPMILDGFEQGSMAIKVLSQGVLDNGLEVKAPMSLGAPVVKISDAYELPNSVGSSGQALVTDGFGYAYWGTPTITETDTLDSVTSRNGITSNQIRTGHHYPAATDVYNLGSTTLRWQTLWLESAARIYFGTSNSSIGHDTSRGFTFDLDGEGDGEPEIRIRTTLSSNTVGSTLRHITTSAPSVGEVLGRTAYAAGTSEPYVDYVVVEGGAQVPTAGSEDGFYGIKTMVNGTLGTRFSVGSDGKLDAEAITLTKPSTTTSIEIDPGASSVYSNLKMYNSTTLTSNRLSLGGVSEASSALEIGEGDLFGLNAYSGARFGYAGESSWQTAYSALNTGRLFLQVGNDTDGIKSVFDVGGSEINDVNFYGDIYIRDVYDNLPKLTLVNDKGAADLQLTADEAASIASITTNLAALNLTTSGASLSQIKLDTANVIIDGSASIQFHEDGTHLFSLPDVNDPATDGHVLVANGVGQPLTFSTTLTGLTNFGVTDATIDDLTVTNDITLSGNSANLTFTGTSATVQVGTSGVFSGGTVNTTYGSINDLATTRTSVGQLLTVLTPPSWAAALNTNQIQGITLQMPGTNPFQATDYKSGIWLIASTDSDLGSPPATPSDYGWVMNIMDATNTAQHFVWRRTTNGSSSVSIIGYLDSNAVAGSIDFTGQHRSVKSASAPAGIENMIGYIVVSDGTYANLDGVSTKPTINEALPRVTLSTMPNQKSVYGVISDAEDENSNERHYSNGSFVSVFEKSDTRLVINAVGEGGIWVTNTSGSIFNGDYITSSEVPGLGCRQGDDIMRSYTVAKATQDCAFDLNSPAYDCEEFVHNGVTYRRAFIGCTYHCG